MRRSNAPSKRLKLGDDENQPDFSKAPPSQGLTFGGYTGVRHSTSGVIGPGTGTQQHPAQQQQQNSAQHTAVQRPPVQQFKCPLPYGQTAGGTRGSLGAKKNYAGGTDLLAAIQRRVVLSDCRQEPGSSNIVSELVLYDPDEHKLQWLAQQDTSSTSAPDGPSTADPAPRLEPTAAGTQLPTAPSAPTTASTAAAAAPGQDTMAWEKRVKVYADPFLVEKLRPHQREGVK